MECVHPRTADWALMGCEEDCVEHEWSHHWLDITGDSYIVDVRVVVGARGAAAYLAKYLAKGFERFSVLSDLGFKRRFTTLRNWPGFGRLRLRGTEEGWWDNTHAMQVWHGDGTSESFRRQAEADRTIPMAVRVGTPLEFQQAKKARNAALVTGFRRVLDAGNRQKDVAEGDRGGD